MHIYSTSKTLNLQLSKSERKKPCKKRWFKVLDQRSELITIGPDFIG